MTPKRFIITVSGEYLDTENDKFYSIEDIIELLNNYSYEKTVIYNKLVNYILDYSEISNSNYMYGISETVEDLQSDVARLFKDPLGFSMEHLAEECEYWNGEECIKFNRELDEYSVCRCNCFKWK